MPLASNLLAYVTLARAQTGATMIRGPSNEATPLSRAARFGAGTLAAVLVAIAIAANAHAETVAAVRVRLHPDAAPPGVLTPEWKARLESLAGTSLTLSGTTRTGALELALPGPLDGDAVRAMLKPMREDRSILWAEPASPKGMARRAAADARSARAGAGTGEKLLVRLAGDPAPDWPPLLSAFAERLGTNVVPERQIGNVWVMRLPQPVSATTLRSMASALESHPAVQYADAVTRRFFPKFVPNDPYFPSQWALTDPVGGINIGSAWDLQLTSPPASTTIAVVDTGILPHSDLANRLLPGYDFISDASMARDGNGRDPDPRDEGDWIDAGGCGGFPARPSSWHGTFVTGIMAADINNGSGIAGVDAYAQVVPVRTLGTCGGTDEDVFEGMLWASGVRIAGVPPNPYPARVINMSLGGYGSCPSAIQDAIDDALAQGSVVVVAAGNESSDTSNFAPSGCSGVITVGATNRRGDIAFYSNFGRRVDISAPGGDFDDGGIVSLSDTGQTKPEGEAYASEIGTSAAAPHVSGVVSMMLARDPTMTAGRVLTILQGTAREFPQGSICANGSVCGAGILDAGYAMASTLPSSLLPPPGAATVVEYYRRDLDHYYLTADPYEIAYIDANPLANNRRTGLYFYAWTDPAYAPPSAVPVCKFYGDRALFIDSYYFTASGADCQYIVDHWPGTWALQSPAIFWVLPVDAQGGCPAGGVPVFRFDNNRQDFNQRHTTDLSVRRAMINRAWVPDGAGKNGVAFCAPI
jgi:serine protease